MRKYKTHQRHALSFRLFLLLAGALMLLGAFTPKANAQLLAYWNFEGPPTPPYPVNMISALPGTFVGIPLTSNFNLADLSAETPGLPLNVAPGDVVPNLTALGFHRTGANSPADFRATFPVLGGGLSYNITSVSFAINVAGNGFSTARVAFSTNGGATFFFTTATQAIPNALTVLTFNIPNNTTLGNQPLTVVVEFDGGQSNGSNLQDLFDNLQINGAIVPEPVTVAGGLLGILGLWWQQRRRLKLILPRSRKT
jgi:hypothetical protein